MQKGSSTSLVVLCDAILVNAAIILAFLIRFSGRVPAVKFGGYLQLIPLITTIRILAFYFTGLYEEDEDITSFDIFYLIFKAATISSIIIITFSFLLQSLPFPRTVFVISWMFNILIISIWHCYLFYAKQKKKSPERVLIVASRESKGLVEGVKKQSSRDFEVIDTGRSDKKGTEPYLEKLKKTVNDRGIKRVIFADPSLSRDKLVDFILYSQTKGMNVWMVPGLYEVVMGRQKIEHLGDIPLIKVISDPLKGKDKSIKAIEDFFISLLILVLFLPLIILISLLLKLESKGPILFKQKRVGLKGKIFKLYKFRSMVENAEAETGPVLASENDERVTKFGDLLRRLHLDELPQFLNILKGEMSLVGPRPERPEFVEEFKRKIQGYSRRFVVNPGITGLAQLYGRYDTSAENKLKYDVAYMNSWSLGLDLKILFISTEIILKRRR